MGVTGLWKLIEPCGSAVPVETLEGKILAIDISIWLHQVVKGFQDSSGSALAHAHLLGLFHRLCKLMYYRVKPVFVFDGCVPKLKRDTIARRKEQRSKLNNEANRIQNLLLEQLAKEEIVQKALGNTANELLPTKRNTVKPPLRNNVEDDMFKLPELPSTSHNISDPSSQGDDFNDIETSFDTSEESSFEEGSAKHHYQNNLQSIDVKSEHFRSLPADMRYDILLDIKETRKQSSWGRLHELPAQSDDFSGFQMKRLLKRRAVQESLEVAEQEMGGRSLTYAELQTFFKEEGLLTTTALEDAARPIASDENTRFLLVRDLKKQIKSEDIKINDSAVAEAEKQQVVENNIIEKPIMAVNPIKKIESIDEEFDRDLQLALALSLENTDEKLYDEKDYVLNDGEQPKLSKAQRQQLQNTAKGPARTYMIEYAGMNEEEVSDILEKTQSDLRENDIVEKTMNIVEMSDSDSDDDLVEVIDEVEIKESENQIEIVINTNKIDDDDYNMFADVFTAIKCPSNEILLNNFDDKKQQEIVNKNEEISQKTKNIDENIISQTQLSILEELRQQLKNVDNINLETIEANNDIIELLSDNDDDNNDKSISAEQQPIINEFIVICDNDICNKEKSQISPVITPRKISSKPGTPIQNNKSITDFYEADYIIKRTPEKIKEEIEEHLAKVVPFFRNKTPKSKSPKNRSNSNSPTTTKTTTTTTTTSKAAKKLFNDSTNTKTTAKTTAHMLQEAANALKEHKSEKELHTMANNLAQERRELESERNRQDRMGMSISQRMNVECQELLRLFGIPYIVAPTEAEAQCAFLDAIELTNGTITDDSDIWLFGGRTVYKNFFAQNKHVLKFSVNEIESKFKCDRQVLVQLACLVGSDYTTGVHGIGAVTALEILSSFGSKRSEQKSPNNDMREKINSALETLERFHDWWQASKMAAVVPGSSARHALLKKLKNIEIHEGFPSMAVIKAYLQPKVDESRAAFTWGKPDVESIREFARKTFGWTLSKTDEMLRPVLKRLNEKRSQTTMKNYFSTRSAVSTRVLKVSKRVQGAIERLAAGPQEEQIESETILPAKKRKQAVKRVRKGKPAKEADAIDTETNAEKSDKQEVNSYIVERNNKEKIPQREKQLEEMRQNRKKAAETLKAKRESIKKKKKT